MLLISATIAGIFRGHSSSQVVMLAGVLIGQIGLGILNVMLLAPVWLQIVHLFVAELFWVVVVLASATLLISPADSYFSARLIINFATHSTGPLSVKEKLG